MVTAAAGKKRPSTFLTVYGAIEGFFNSAAIWLIIGLMLVTVADIILRTITGRSIPGGYELVELMLGACFLAISYTQKQKGHVRMDLVLVKMPERVRFASEVIAMLVSLSICVVIFSQNVGQTLQAIDMHLTSAGLVAYPLWPTRLVLSIGFLLISLRLIIQIVEMLRHKPEAPES
jgi:TRAP-type C4-dicarboxylate transport system permease small subunit